MRPPILGSLLHAALVVGSAAQPRPPAQHARPSLHDPLLVDPGGVAAEHEHGLRPHHSSGAAAEDPLLFRHRYQHHDAASDRLLYYQYEAKRHPHVVMLEDIGVNKCEASSAASEGGQNVTEIVLVVSSQSGAAQLSTGTIVSGSGSMHCVFRAADGSVSPWRKTLRDRVISASATAAPHYPASAVEVTLQTVEAALNEVFEHAQVEFFHGRTHSLEAARGKRLNSLARTGHQPARYEFASSVEVVAQAKQAAVVVARRELTAKPKQVLDHEASPSEIGKLAGAVSELVNQSTSSTSSIASIPTASGALKAATAAMVSRISSAHDQPMSEYQNTTGRTDLLEQPKIESETVKPLDWDDGLCYTFSAQLYAQLCSAHTPGPIMNDHDCARRTDFVDADGNYLYNKIALKVGNEYTLRWTGGPPQGGDVRISIWETDGSFGVSSLCTNDIVTYSQYYTGA